MRSEPITILRLEIDGHFHGSSDVPRPWVARIDGIDQKYGLARTFLERVTDWRGARKAWSGNVYGRVAAFALREGGLYEANRLRGKSCKRRVVREFYRVTDGELIDLAPAQALAIAERYSGPAVEHYVPDMTTVGLIRGVGTPDQLGFVLVEGRRIYRLRVGELHEISSEDGTRHIVLVHDGRIATVSQAEAILRLANREAA